MVHDDSEWGQHNRQLVALLGGPTMLAALHDQLIELLRLRLGAVVVRSEPDGIESTYVSLLEALRDPG